MKNSKLKIIIGIVVFAILGSLTFVYRDSIFEFISSIGGSKESVYVEQVSLLNGKTNGLTSRFGGIIETQDIYKVKADSSKTIEEVHVKVGDVVEVGQPLFTYNMRDLQLEIDQKKLEIESLSNEIAVNQQQIDVYTQQMESLSPDEQFEFQAEIQNLNNEISQVQYDIGCVELEVETLEKDMESAMQVVTEKVNDICKNILFNTSVYKKDEQGYKGFTRFLKACALEQKKQ